MRGQIHAGQHGCFTTIWLNVKIKFEIKVKLKFKSHYGNDFFDQLNLTACVACLISVKNNALNFK